MTEETPTRPGLPSRKLPTRPAAEVAETVMEPGTNALLDRIAQLERENRKLRDMLRDPRLRMPR